VASTSVKVSREWLPQHFDAVFVSGPFRALAVTSAAGWRFSYRDGGFYP